MLLVQGLHLEKQDSTEPSFSQAQLLLVSSFISDSTCLNASAQFCSQKSFHCHFSGVRAASERHLGKAAQQKVSHVNHLTSMGHIYELGPASSFTFKVLKCWLLDEKHHLRHPSKWRNDHRTRPQGGREDEMNWHL